MRNLIRAFIGISLLISVVWATLPATDAFVAANGTALTAYSANWTVSQGTWDIQGNSAHTTIAGASGGVTQAAYGLAFWNADTFGGDQSSSVKMTTSNTGTGYFGPAVRVTAGGNGYMCICNGGSVIIDKMVSGTTSFIGLQGSLSVIAGDTVTLTARGTALNCYVNGILKLTRTDSSIGAAGSAGIATYGSDASGTAFRGDNFKLSHPRVF